jgi:hypothetical protein
MENQNTETKPAASEHSKAQSDSVQRVVMPEGDELAIQFAEWVGKLRPSEMVSVWSKDGQYKGLFTMDTEQLLAKFKKLKQRGII